MRNNIIGEFRKVIRRDELQKFYASGRLNIQVTALFSSQWYKELEEACVDDILIEKTYCSGFSGEEWKDKQISKLISEYILTIAFTVALGEYLESGVDMKETASNRLTSKEWVEKVMLQGCEQLKSKMLGEIKRLYQDYYNSVAKGMELRTS